MPEPIPCEVCGARLRPENEAGHMRRVHPTAAYTPRSPEATRPAKESFYLTSRAKKVLFAVVAAVVLVAAGGLMAMNLAKDRPIDSSATVVRISMAGWDPPTLTTRVGSPLKVDVVAMDDAHGAGHDFRIDELGVNQYAGSGQIVFTVPADAPGTYTYYCSLCCGGRGSPSMVGTFTVSP